MPASTMESSVRYEVTVRKTGTSISKSQFTILTDAFTDAGTANHLASLPPGPGRLRSYGLGGHTHIISADRRRNGQTACGLLQPLNFLQTASNGFSARDALTTIMRGSVCPVTS